MADPIVFKTDDHGAKSRDKLNDLAQRAQVVINNADAVLNAKTDVLQIKGEIDATAAAVAVDKAAAQEARTGAETAQGVATQARDDAQLYASQAAAQTKIYDTEELGRAAVGDGQAFKVRGSGDVVVQEYLRIDADTSTLEAEYPSVDRLRDVSEEMEFTRNALMVALYGDGPYPVFHEFFIGPYNE